MPTKKKRVWELDFLRGVAVIAMCFDHLMCDFVFLESWFSNYNAVDNGFIRGMVRIAGIYLNSAFRFWAHYLFVFIFLFLVGISCAFSKNNTKRGSQLFFVALIVTAFSFLLRHIGVLEYGIVFGILHCISLCILLAATLDSLTKFNKKLNTYAPLVIGFLILAVGIDKKFWLMSDNYDDQFNASHLIGYIMGTHAYGDDWFGIFPYLGIVLMGLYCGKTIYAKRESYLPRLNGSWNRPFKFVGRHALILYVVHQGVLAGLVALLCVCLGYRF